MNAGRVSSSPSRLQPGERVMVLSGRWYGRYGIFRGWTGRTPCADVDLEPAGRALARRVRVTTLGHTRISRLPASCLCPIGKPCSCVVTS